MNELRSVAPNESARMMPPRRMRAERVQLNARIPVDVEQRLRRFVRDHDTTVQDCVHMALTEFLGARGYSPASA